MGGLHTSDGGVRRYLSHYGGRPDYGDCHCLFGGWRGCNSDRYHFRFVEYYTKVKTGAYSQKDADFITLEIPQGHPFVGKSIDQVFIPEGLYVAVLLRDGDVNTPYPKLIIETGDNLLLGTTGSMKMDGKLEEVTLEQNHPWIDSKIKDLDISRQVFVVMVKRKERNIRPTADMVLKENDIVLLLEKGKNK